MAKQLRPKKEDGYENALAFAKAKPFITYPEFDNFTTSDLRLFVVPKNEQFQALDRDLDKIIRALPSLKRIFTKPITRLTDTESILPTETVRVINNQSVVHASLHSELWGDINEEGLKPRKLLTIDRRENYVIYENVAFVRLIKQLRAYVQRNARLLKDVMYASRDLQFNLLERANHINYFLAIGKLHIGYARAQESYLIFYQRCLEKLFFVEKTLRSKLGSTVYKQCCKNKSKLTLKKTNVFRLHKDYMQVYALLKWFNDDGNLLPDDEPSHSVEKAEYVSYCNALAVFSAGHFNFVYPKTQQITLDVLKARAKLAGWSLKLENAECEGITGLLFTVKKEKTYRICLLLGVQSSSADLSAINAFKKAVSADEYLFANADEYSEKNSVYLSVYDVDSFRRIQQILLRGMLYADTERTTCPFCEHALSKQQDGAYICEICHTKISTHVCPETQKTYFSTLFDRARKIKKQDTEQDKFLFDKVVEAQQHYRNITTLTPSGKPVCPYCGNVHDLP